MKKIREEYSEDLESYYRRMERISENVVKDLQNQTRSKNSEEMLGPVYNFFLHCYHLREWINKDSKVSEEVKRKLPTFEKTESPVQFLICRDACNKSKHVILTENYRPNDVNTQISPIGGAIFSISTKELKESGRKKETIHLKAEDSIFLGDFIVSFRNKNYDLKGVVQGCMYVWKIFFEENDLLLPRVTPYL
jgi:hypothetical protein